MCWSVGGRWRAWSSLWPPWGLQTMPSALNKQNSPQNLLGVFCCSHKNSPPQSSGILEIRPAEEGGGMAGSSRGQKPQVQRAGLGALPLPVALSPSPGLAYILFNINLFIFIGG